MAIFRETATDLRILNRVQPLVCWHYAWSPVVDEVGHSIAGLIESGAVVARNWNEVKDRVRR